MTWREHIARALETQTTHHLSDVEAMIADGSAQLWECDGGAAVTEIVAFPRERWLTIWLTGGDMEKLFAETLPDIEAYARVERCHKVVLGGRKGWKKALSPHGYSEIASVCAKDVS